MGMKQISGNELRGHLETMLLSALERGDAHGFELMQRLTKQGRGLLQLREGTLYPVLYRLEGAGLIKGTWEDGSQRRRGPRRCVYSLTGDGRQELQARRETWRDFVSVIGEIVEAPA